MKLKKEIEQAIQEMGFVDLTDIQQKTIPLLLQGNDVIGNSHTGTGKTAAFGIPVLETIDFDEVTPQALIITPTRELAVQIKGELTRISKYLNQCKIAAVYGGEIITKQFRDLKKRPQIIVGTPGRILDHLKRKTIRLEDLKYLILDEADEMLKMGFIDDIETIINYTPKEKQTLMFSATMPKRIVELAKKYMIDPEVVTSVGNELTNKDISQYYYKVRRENKTEAVYRLLNIYRPTLALIFCNTKAKVDQLTQDLIDRKINCDKIHGDLPQTTRLDVLRKFHQGIIDVLVATDVAARGLDIKDVEAVFNYDTPEKADYYIHRIGRTGRIGRLGYSFTLVSKGELKRIQEIEALTKTKIKRRNIPTYDRVIDVKADKFVEEIMEVSQEKSFDKEYKTLNKLIQAGLKEDEIIVSLLKKLQTEQDHSENKRDINETFAGRQKKDFSGKQTTTRFYMSVGKKQNLTVSDILDYVRSNIKISKREIKDIAILSEFSFFTIPQKYANVLLSSKHHGKLKGKRVVLQVTRKKR